MTDSIFSQSLKKRENDQEAIKANLNLKEAKEVKKKAEKIYLSLPSDCKEMFLAYCEEHHTTASAQLRTWIYEFCDK